MNDDKQNWDDETKHDGKVATEANSEVSPAPASAGGRKESRRRPVSGRYVVERFGGTQKFERLKVAIEEEKMVVRSEQYSWTSKGELLPESDGRLAFSGGFRKDNFSGKFDTGLHSMFWDGTLFRGYATFDYPAGKTDELVWRPVAEQSFPELLQEGMGRESRHPGGSHTPREEGRRPIASRDPLQEPTGYRPPATARELLDRHAAGERYFEGVQLAGANLSGRHLEGANLTRANLEGSNLSEAHLDGANLFQTNLQKAKLYRGSLREASLAETALEGADLMAADFSDAGLHDVSYDRRGRYRGIRIATAHGDQRFIRFAQDQAYIEEFRSKCWREPVFWVWLILSDCGRSMILWAAWSAVLAASFGLVFFHALGQRAFAVAHLDWSVATCIYYSVVTFTTLGFGDIVPKTSEAAWWVTAEVILGYIMLGGLLSILANKLARRA